MLILKPLNLIDSLICRIITQRLSSLLSAGLCKIYDLKLFIFFVVFNHSLEN